MLDDNQTPIFENSPSAEENGTNDKQSLDAIADDLSTSMPDVQPHALEQELKNEEERLAQYSHLVDVDGNPFDPAIHKVNKAGEPTTSPKGRLIKKAGRKKGSTNKGAHNSYVGGGGAQPTQEHLNKAQARATGTVAANLVMQLGVTFGGDEWSPRVDEQTGLNERSMLEGAFADYFESTGKTDLPPAMALTVAIGAYALPRFAMPKTQSRLQKLTGGIKKWYANRKLKAHGLRAEKIDERERQTPRSASLEV